jgi:hypothetical protein
LSYKEGITNAVGGGSGVEDCFAPAKTIQPVGILEVRGGLDIRGQKTEDRGQRTGDRAQRTGDRAQKGCWRLEVRGLRQYKEILESWNPGIMGKTRQLTQHSIIPAFHYSTPGLCLQPKAERSSNLSTLLYARCLKLL